MKFVHLITPKFLGKTENSDGEPNNKQKRIVSITRILQRPVTLVVYTLIIIVIISFSLGMLTPKVFSLIGFGNETFSIQTNSGLTPTPDGLLRSNAALLEGEIKVIKENSLVIISQEEKIEIKISGSFSKNSDQKIATFSSGRRLPITKSLPEMKEGDTVQLGVEVINGETVITNIFVKKSASE